MSTIPLTLLFLSSHIPLYPLVLCTYCSSVPMFICLPFLCTSFTSVCSSVLTVPQHLLVLCIYCSSITYIYCSSVPTTAMFLCIFCSSVLTVPQQLLSLCIHCSCVSTLSLLAIPKLSRELGGVSNFSKSINWHHYMKDHVEIGHLTKYYALRVNRDRVMNLEIRFRSHTNVSNFKVIPLK